MRESIHIAADLGLAYMDTNKHPLDADFPKDPFLGSFEMQTSG
jgi:hypothetical protein